MKFKNFLIRILFCLPFIAIVFYINSYHGELINNAQVEWKYTQNDKGKIYLALDVYSPSGIKVDIFSKAKNIANLWKLTNYPKKVPHLYLPYNKDSNVLYATEKYTFLYEWNSESPIPPESSIKVKYQNTGTQNYYKAKHISDIKLISNIDFSEIFRHIVAIIFIIYFVLICKIIGTLFIKKFGIVLDNPASNLVISIFLGIIFLTYLFFIIGILKLLYFPLIFIILFAILLFGIQPDGSISELKVIFINEVNKIKQHPWKIIFLGILFFMLFYNLFYCFVPATYVDGSGDITNSYLPLLNDYIISHSFKAAIQNSTIGINSQVTDVLRTVVKMFSGEPEVYLLSFVYLLLIIGSIYLIGKEIFNINSMLIYLSLLLLLSADLFTEAIHLGKHHVSVLSFLFISIYSTRFSEHNKNYILPAIFFAFLTSQYIHFIMLPLLYYLFVFIYSFYKKNSDFRLHLKSLIIFCILFPVFYLKLIIEVGTCFPPGMIPVWISDLFLMINQKNDFYKYIDNNYIRHFYKYHGLANFALYVNPIPKTIILSIKTVCANLDFSFILLFFPLLQKMNRYKILYIFETIVLVFLFVVIFPEAPRLIIFYIFPLIILQFTIVDNILLKFDNLIPKKLFLLKKGFILLILFFVIFDVPTVFPLSIKFRKYKYLDNMYIFLNYRSKDDRWYYKEVLPIFFGLKSKYQYLNPGGSQKHFNHAMLIRQYTDTKDTILIVPVRFHNHTNRIMTVRHALGSVIYQEDINKIMSDLKRLNIKYLSTMPINYPDYNPFYTSIFEEHIFYKYFKLLFSDNGNNFYKIIYDGSNTEYTPSPYNVEELPFVPMFRNGLNLIGNLDNWLTNSASIRFFTQHKKVHMEISTEKSSGEVIYEIPKEKYKGKVVSLSAILRRVKNCSAYLSIDDGVSEIKSQPTNVGLGTYEFLSVKKRLRQNPNTLR